jgi:hypothetical protein
MVIPGGVLGPTQRSAVSLYSVFPHLVRSAFSYLERDYGFRAPSEVPPYVIYQSQTHRVLVYFNEEDRDGGPDVLVERAGEDPRAWPPYTLRELAAVTTEGSAREPAPRRSRQSARSLADDIVALAHDLRLVAGPTLAGEESQLARIDVVRAELGMVRGEWGKPGQTRRH